MREAAPARSTRYVVLRDDDTNALTPVECLERLYRPFLDRRLPVNLAVIPEVRADVTRPDGRPEGFLFARRREMPGTVPLAEHRELVDYLRENPGYHIVQHGCHHEAFEFDRPDPREIERRLERGACCLEAAGFPQAETFVAPHDRLSRAAFACVAARFQVLSTGWFELRRLPLTWWPRYGLKRARQAAHWRVRHLTLLSHPGCLLSSQRPYDSILPAVEAAVRGSRLTVLVTHWWEYFEQGKPDERLIEILHQTAAYLAGCDGVKVIRFADLATGRVSLGN